MIAYLDCFPSEYSYYYKYSSNSSRDGGYVDFSAQLGSRLNVENKREIMWTKMWTK